MITTAVETATAYVFTVTEGEQVFTYEWGKQPSDGQKVQEYLQNCKREAELLATDSIARTQMPIEVKL